MRRVLNYKDRMSNYRYIRSLIDRYILVISLFKMVGVKSDGLEFKLDSCYFMLGWR